METEWQRMVNLAKVIWEIAEATYVHPASVTETIRLRVIQHLARAIVQAAGLHCIMNIRGEIKEAQRELQKMEDYNA